MPDLLWIPERPIVHVVEFNTNILKSYDGSEQRIAKITQPLQSLEMLFRFDTEKQIRQFRTELFRNLSSNWRVPLWWDPDFLTVTASSGASSLTGDFALSNIVVGDKIILFNAFQEDSESFSTGNVDIHTVLTKNATTITLDGTTLNEAYPAGSRIYRLVDMRIRIPAEFQRHAYAVEDFQVTFDYYGRSDLGGNGATAPSTYQQSDDDAARQLLDRRSFANSPVTIAVEDGSERFDPAAGDFEQFSSWDELEFTEARHYGITDRADLRWWENFFKLVVGAREPFYAPTYRQDLLHLTQPSGPSWDFFTVADEAVDPSAAQFAYPSDWYLSAAHKSLRLATDQGEQYKEVTTPVDNGDGTVDISLTSGLTANSVISEISLLERVRLGADIIRFQYDGYWPGNSSRVSFTTRTTQSTENP